MQLVDPTLEALHVKVVERLQKQGGVDLDRVVFVPRMRHNELMAMNKLTGVVLDSVFFGGDTTTREAFEVGAPVVTLPGKTIGQRWTQAYYAVMGIKRLHREERRRERPKSPSAGKREFKQRRKPERASKLPYTTII